MKFGLHATYNTCFYTPIDGEIWKETLNFLKEFILRRGDVTPFSTYTCDQPSKLGGFDCKSDSFHFYFSYPFLSTSDEELPPSPSVISVEQGRFFHSLLLFLFHSLFSLPKSHLNIVCWVLLSFEG